MYKQMIILRTDLGLGKGKLAAQAAHASLAAYNKADGKVKERWEQSGAKKVVAKVASEKELMVLFAALNKTVPCALIRDAGKTQTAPGTATAVGAGPAEEKLLDRITKHLKLL